MDKVEGRRQVFLNLRARNRQCVSMTEIAQILSRICGSPMTPEQGSRSIVNGEFHTVHFVEDVSYQILYGVASLTREAEKVSGDNYICRQEEDGRFFSAFRMEWGPGWKLSRKAKLWWSCWNSLWNPDFPRNSSTNGEFGTDSERKRRNVFHGRYLCSGSLHGNL